MIVVDVGCEEFDVAPGGLVAAGIGYERRHYIGAGRRRRDWNCCRFDDCGELGSFDFSPKQKLRHDGGNLIFVTPAGHAFEMLAQPRLVPKLPASLSEMFVEARAICIGGDTPASKAELHICVRPTSPRFSELEPEPVEDNGSQPLISEQLVAFGALALATGKANSAQRHVSPDSSCTR